MKVDGKLAIAGVAAVIIVLLIAGSLFLKCGSPTNDYSIEDKDNYTARSGI